ATFSVEADVAFPTPCIRAAMWAGTRAPAAGVAARAAPAATVGPTRPGRSDAEATQSDSSTAANAAGQATPRRARGRPHATGGARAQRPARPSEPAAERPLAPADLPGGLALGPPLQVAGAKRRAPLLGQLGQLGIEGGERLPPAHVLGRRAVGNARLPLTSVA